MRPGSSALELTMHQFEEGHPAHASLAVRNMKVIVLVGHRHHCHCCCFDFATTTSTPSCMHGCWLQDVNTEVQYWKVLLCDEQQYPSGSWSPGPQEEVSTPTCSCPFEGSATAIDFSLSLPA